MKFYFVIFLFFLVNCNNFKTETNKINDSSQNVFREEPIHIWPKIIKKAETIYPDSLKESGIVGTVWVECTIDTSGALIGEKIIKSDNERLNYFALKTVKRYKFSPASINNKKVIWNLVIPIEFK